MSQEHVLCMSARVMQECGVGHGFTPFGAPPAYSLHNAETLFNRADTFLPRDLAETDDRYKQIIAYCIIEKVPSAQDDPAVFAYRRRGDQEKRLRGLNSIGVGGHINSDDCNGIVGFKGIEVGFLRELAEEVLITMTAGERFEWLGVVNDDSNPVGRVHLGVVARIRTARPIRPAFSYWDGCGFYPVSALLKSSFFDMCETWTQLLLGALYGVASAGN